MNEAPSNIATVNESVVSKKVFDMGLVALANLPGSLSDEQAGYYLTNRGQIPDAWRRGFALPKPDAPATPIVRVPIPSGEVEWWGRYWRDNYGVTESFEKLTTPAPPEFPVRLVVMHWRHSSRCNRVAEVYRKRCENRWWQYANDLNVSVVSHIRGGTYAIWVPDTRDAEFGWDEESKRNLSSQNVWDKNLTPVTLPERLVDGDTYLVKRKEHLDREKVTVCAGSRDADGDVPSVDLFSDGRVDVSCWSPGNAGGKLRFRLAIV